MDINTCRPVARAEALWALKVAVSNWSFRSCDDMVDIMHMMFPDDPVCKDMNIASTKLSYVISHGLGPYFHNKMILDIKKSQSYMTLEIDETTTEQTVKQLDMHIRYWSATSNSVVVRYLGSAFIGHAEADKLHTQVINAMTTDGLDLCKLLMMSSDGPNVNKTLYKLLDNDCKKAGSVGLLDVGTCSLHKVHNAFGAALDETGWEMDAVIIDIYQWFKLSAARREDYINVQKLLDVPEQTFLRFVQCRWLSLLPALERVSQQWDSLYEYFVKYLPAKQQQACKNDRYKRIHRFMKEETSKAKIQFLINAAIIFNSFLTLFQAEGPLIHILYPKIVELYKQVLTKFVKEEFVSKEDLTDESITLPGNELADDKLDIGLKTRDCLRKVSTACMKYFLIDVRKFLRKLAERLRKTLPLENKLLRDLQFLHPWARSDDNSNDAVTRIARKIPHIIPDADLDKVIGQFKVYRLDADIDDTWFIEDKGTDADGNPYVKWRRLDVYWRKVFNQTDALGLPKYPHLTRYIFEENM
jgi:hypothetical protein